MKDIPYASAVEILMHAQVCTLPDISYAVEKLDRYLINLGIDHWKTCQEGNAISTEDYIKSDQLQLIGYTDSNYVEYIDNRKSTSGYIFLIVGRWWI